MAKHKLRVGDIVRCQGALRRVEYLYKDIDGGVKLDRYVGDFKSWNETDLVFVRHASKEWLQVHAWLVHLSKQSA